MGKLDAIRRRFLGGKKRQDLECALRERNERARVTLRAVGDGVVCVDRHGIVESLNPAAGRLTGWPLEQALGRPLAEIIRLEGDRGVKGLDPLAVEPLPEGRARPFESLLISRGGRRHRVEIAMESVVVEEEEVSGTVLVLRDVTEAHRLTRRLDYQATHDSLTGLLNRRAFEKALQEVLERDRGEGSTHALCYLDLDQFRLVNNTAGHLAGDQLLCQVCDLFRRRLGDRDVLGRLGGDEFGLLLRNCTREAAKEICEQLVKAVAEFRFVWKGASFKIGLSVGVVPIHGHALDSVKLLTQSDVACYSAKEQGRGRVHVYGGDRKNVSQHHHSRLYRAAGLMDALRNDRFFFFCQPIVDLRDDAEEPVSYELLLRLLDTDARLLLPGEFIPAAERFGLMAAIDRWVVRVGLWHFAYSAQGANGAGVSINLSGDSFADPSLLDFLRQQLDDCPLPPSRVCFEITETAAVRNLDRATELIMALKEYGCRFALDDFGSGLCSFTYLKNLPVDYLKIDGGFVRGMLKDSGDRAVVEAINQVGHVLGLKTVAECVETPELEQQVREIGVDFGQGYGLGRPVALEHLDPIPRGVRRAG